MVLGLVKLRRNDKNNQRNENMIVLEEKVKIMSSLNEESEREIENMADSILKTL